MFLLQQAPHPKGRSLCQSQKTAGELVPLLQTIHSSLQLQLAWATQVVGEACGLQTA